MYLTFSNVTHAYCVYEGVNDPVEQQKNVEAFVSLLDYEEARHVLDATVFTEKENRGLKAAVWNPTGHENTHDD